MRKTLAAVLVLAAAAVALPAAGAARAGEFSGCDCNNECPLAQEANKHRATGEEAVLASKFVRDDLVRIVMKNLASL